MLNKKGIRTIRAAAKRGALKPPPVFLITGDV
jgi:hypothetical protein